jgi:ribosome maturation protein Sdo1
MLEVEEKYQASKDERFKRIKESALQTAERVRRLKEHAAACEREAQLLNEEAVQKKTALEIGDEVTEEAVQEAFETARMAENAAKEAKDNVEQAMKELRLKQEMLMKEEEAVKTRIAMELRQKHREAVKKLQAALEKAAKVNTEVLRIERAFDLNKKTRNTRLSRTLGGIPQLGWYELLNAMNPDGTRNKKVPMSQYERWIKRVREYGYLED